MDKITTFKYSVVIRTLGKAGEKYQKMLDSLMAQSIKPSAIIIYIADGYEIPKETVGFEQYVYVKKGMVAQRALAYDEVKTEYVLFLDDDVYLPPTGVEALHNALVENNADVISPDVFPNHKRGILSALMMLATGRMRQRKDDGKWAYKVMRTGGYSYNGNPQQKAYLSSTNAGPCFFCKKEDFLKIHFEEELWMDAMSYAIGDDQVMFYKMYLNGLKQLTLFGSGIIHMDAGTTMRNEDKEKRLIYADFRFKTIFWHRFLYLPDKSWCSRQISKFCIGYSFFMSILISLAKGRIDIAKLKWNAIKEGIAFINSTEYKSLLRISKIQ